MPPRAFALAGSTPSILRRLCFVKSPSACLAFDHLRPVVVSPCRRDFLLCLIFNPGAAPRELYLLLHARLPRRPLLLLHAPVGARE